MVPATATLRDLRDALFRSLRDEDPTALYDSEQIRILAENDQAILTDEVDAEQTYAYVKVAVDVFRALERIRRTAARLELQPVQLFRFGLGP